MSGPQDHTSDEIELLPADAVTPDESEAGAADSSRGRRGSSGGARDTSGGRRDASRGRAPSGRGRGRSGGGSADAKPRALSPWSVLLAGGIVVALLFGQWPIVVGILGLAALITIHEFGHFIAAKSFGMRVEKFYIGFPPAAWKRRKGETEYGVGLIPLGGFCKISGMSETEELPDEVKPRAYYSQPVWKRNLVIFADPP